MEKESFNTQQVVWNTQQVIVIHTIIQEIIREIIREKKSHLTHNKSF